MSIGLKLQLVNHNLIAAMKEAGYTSNRALAIELGCHPGTVGDWVKLKSVPTDEKTITNLERALRLPLDFLFPEEIRLLVRQKRKVKHYIADVRPLLPLGMVSKAQLGYTDEAVTNSDRTYVCANALASLNSQEKTVIEMTYGLADKTEHSFSQIGKKLGRSVERVRQIHAKALRKLRHPNRVKPLTELI